MPLDDSHSSSVREASQSGELPAEVLAERIDAFSAAWDEADSAGADPPRLDRFAEGMEERAAREVLIELAKLDIERRWQENRQPQHLEWYAAEYTQLTPIGKLPVDLIYEELQARMMAGLPVYQDEVRQRFPVQAESLLRLLGGLALSGSPTATYYADTVIEEKGADKAKGGKPSIGPFVSLRPGDQLDDFQLLTPLGSGAFARVFLARQVSMERLVALKISAHSGSEPQTLAQLDHPNIVRVYDQRSCAEPPARLLYMEVVSGGTLHDIVTRARNSYEGKASGLLLLNAIDERLSAVGAAIPESSSARDWIADATWPEVVCRLGAELADGLAYAHAHGVMHRDIKPANVLLSAEGKPKLADFNVSYNGGRADENPEDTFGGSLAYMSPEQLEACHPLLGGSPRGVRETSDLYAVGVMLWELLTGRRPFRDENLPVDGGGSLVRLQRMIETRRRCDFKLLAEQLPEDCPASLREVLIKCLQPEKEQRYQSAEELSRALRMCLNPRCWRLLQEPKGRVGRFILKWPVLSGVIAGLLPNALTARFNLFYNRERISDQWPDLSMQFEDVQIWTNVVAFTIGIGGGAWLIVRAMRFVRGQMTPQEVDGGAPVLRFGRILSCLILTLWTTAGLVFPIAVAWRHPDSVGVEFYLHFFMSLALCGFAATAYPYFLITAGLMHYFLPAMIRRGALPGPRRSELRRVTTFNWIHFAMAASVPLLGVLIMSAFNYKKDFALRGASGGGLAGLALVGLLLWQIELDRAALEHLAVDEARGNAASRTSNARSSRAGSRG